MHPWAVLSVMLLAFLLRVYDLARHELWFDEALSAVTARKTVTDIIAYTQSAPFEHPPLYYLALHSWVQVAGVSEFALRYFSLFWGVLLIPLVYTFMASWGGRTFALLAAFVAALSSTTISHSQNARMYSLVAILGLLLLHLFFRAIATRQYRWWAGFLVVSALGIATHYYFALLLLVPLAFLALAGRRYRRMLAFLLAVQLACGVLVAVWFNLSPGLQEAVQKMLSGGAGTFTSLFQRVAHTAGGVISEPPIAGHLAIGALALLGLVFWPLPQAPQAHPVNLIGSRRFLVLWLLVPWLAALAIPYWLQDRHLAYLWPAVYAMVGCGLLALRGRSQGLFIGGLLVVVITSGVWLYSEHDIAEFEFGRIMAYIEDRAKAEDLVVMNQPEIWPLVGYYADKGLPVAYVPSHGRDLSEEQVDAAMRPLTERQSRIWLGPIGAWTADPTSSVEQWLASHAFQAHKEWFPGSGSAALYFTAKPLELAGVEPGVQGANGIRLLGAESSERVVEPGDALRLLFTWQAGRRVESSQMVGLYLVDEFGQVWADRQSEPCAGWCPTTDLEPGAIFEDRHALLIPAGTPPGTYRLQFGWFDPQGGELSGPVNGQRMDLGEVQVVRPSRASALALPEPVHQYPIQAEFGQQLALVGADLDLSEVMAGGTIDLALGWLVRSQPSGDHTAKIELVGPDGRATEQWEVSPTLATFPTSRWQVGEYVLGRQHLRLSQQVAAGRYLLRLSLLDPDGRPLPVSDPGLRQGLDGLVRSRSRPKGATVPIAALAVLPRPERPRRFDLPSIAHPLHMQLAQKVEFHGFDLKDDAAEPGGQLDLVLVWRAHGPTDRPYKVFVHLTEDLLRPLAQDDNQPGSGCCPTDTWVEGEVVEDAHAITIPTDLRPGTYRLLVGMYDEGSGERLPVLDDQGNELAQDYIPITRVMIRPKSTPTPTPFRPGMTNHVFLPVIKVNW